MRLPDAAARLNRYLERVRRAPVRPGEFDCALKAAGVVEALTGRDPAAAYRGRYATDEEGRALLAADGFDGPVAFARAQLRAVPRIRAQRGDLAVVAFDGGETFGVVLGAQIELLSQEQPFLIGLMDDAGAAALGAVVSPEVLRA